MKKIQLFLVVLSFTLAFLSSAGVARASSNQEIVCPVFDQPTSNCNLNRILSSNVNTLGQMILGKAGDSTSQKNSAVGFFSNSIGTLIINRPVSFGSYVAFMSSRFHIPGTPFPTFAASPNPSQGGTGFTEIEPALIVWTTIRNIAYFGFAVIFIVIGIMIMIRSKVDPKTVLTVQAALPKIIITLIVVTFSYAISGLLVDFMYVSIALVITLTNLIDPSLAGLGKNVVANTLFHAVLDGNLWGNIGNAAYAVNIVVQNFVGGANSVAGIAGSILGLVTGGIAFLIIAIAILFALFKTWMMLISAYANTLLAIVTSPIQLMMDAIPGQNRLGDWIRNILSNLMAFPAVLAMLMLGQFLTKGGSGNLGDSAASFIPPLIGGNDQQAVQSLVGIAIVLTMPKTVEIIQEMIKAPKNKWGNAWGEATKWSQGVAMTGAGKGYGWGRDKAFGADAAKWEEAYKQEKANPLASKAPRGLNKSYLAHKLGAKDST